MVWEALRNQYTTLTATRARAPQGKCTLCGVLLKRRKKYCDPCGSQTLDDAKAAYAKARYAARKASK